VNANKKLLLVLSSSMLLYWLLSKTIDVYQIIIIGVLYEIIWFPMLVMFIVLPILSTNSLFKTKNNLIPYFSLALNIITILIVFLV
jgi:hypothetical protein